MCVDFTNFKKLNYLVLKFKIIGDSKQFQEDLEILPVKTESILQTHNFDSIDLARILGH